MRLKIDYTGRQFGDYSPEFLHVCDMNYHGIYLFRKAPLSLWPRMLEKAANNENWCGDSDVRSSVIFDLLKGPAFAGG